ncbi:hypothetical protein H4Q26_008122 [Puccinia striiformis f. sp. tritici PST-130]|nr:hypothetical protein H4Q26_008122 [Puccinia striiformis f. sp. tritici PST-130]
MLCMEAYDPIHPAGLIQEYLDKKLHLGKVDESKLKQILTDVSNINHSTTILGTKTSIPLYITATALAWEYNLSGMVISNHGGQQLDYSLSAQEILISIVSELKSRKMYNLQEFAIFVDGGICRSSNIIKALCCGASAVGTGRPFLYTYSVYGHHCLN